MPSNGRWLYWGVAAISCAVTWGRDPRSTSRGAELVPIAPPWTAPVKGPAPAHNGIATAKEADNIMMITAAFAIIFVNDLGEKPPTPIFDILSPFFRKFCVATSSNSFGRKSQHLRSQTSD